MNIWQTNGDMKECVKNHHQKSLVLKTMPNYNARSLTNDATFFFSFFREVTFLSLKRYL